MKFYARLDLVRMEMCSHPLPSFEAAQVPIPISNIELIIPRTKSIKSQLLLLSVRTKPA